MKLENIVAKGQFASNEMDFLSRSIMTDRLIQWCFTPLSTALQSYLDKGET